MSMCPDCKSQWISDADVKVKELEAENTRLRTAVIKYLSAKGHDLCHENRQELAMAFGLSNDFERGPSHSWDFILVCQYL